MNNQKLLQSLAIQSFRSERPVGSRRSLRLRHQRTTLPRPINSNQGGFTLIEVMVALAILAVAAVAASRASSAYLRSVETLKTRTLAHFVAQNTAADLRINQTWLTSDQRKKVSEQGEEWQVVMSVSDTMTPAVKSVRISVAPIVEGESKNTVTDLTVMISNPKQSGSKAPKLQRGLAQ